MLSSQIAVPSCTWDAVVLHQLKPSFTLSLTTQVLQSLYGLAVQLEWQEERVLQLDTHPLLKCVLFEKPQTKRKYTFLYCWYILVFNSYYPPWMSLAMHSRTIKVINYV